MSGNMERPRLGISACLLGERVRYDGDHKRHAFIADVLSQHVEWVPVCPEVAIGMGVPRPPLRLTGDAKQPRAVGVDDSGLDVTAVLTAYGRRMALELDVIDGYIFKARSPSCGVARVKVFDGKRTRTNGAGLYARKIMVRRPLVPVAEEGDLDDGARRDNFLERVFAHRRWRLFVAEGFTPARLMEFHSVHKLQLMAHGAEHYRALGRLVAEGAALRPRQLCEQYGAGFMAALKHPATPKRHANVLQHLMGYLKKQIDHEDKRELLQAIDACRLGSVPLAVPQTLLRHHFSRHPHPYVVRQLYLYPEPAEARLRYTDLR